ncbi:MAG: hypothetical protein H7336_06420 [Bacteriovorax sp.]|nr:hypothetical protein [Bacteriovorax sp.]
MKSLLLTALVLTISSGVQARSILVFKSVNKCQSIKKQDAILVDVQEAQDGQAQLVISNPLSSDAPVKIQTKKILPPPMNAGGSIRYAGKNEITKENVTLALGIRPIQVGTLKGRGATLSLEKKDEIQMICTAAK